MKVRKITTHADLEAVYPVIRELRTHLTFQDYISLIAEAKVRDEYELVAVFNGEQCIAAMGFRVLYDFVHGKHLYIDDLVVTESCRSQGVGVELLKYAERVGLEKKCKGLRLWTGSENVGGKKFYEREGWHLRAVVYKRTLEITGG